MAIIFPLLFVGTILAIVFFINRRQTDLLNQHCAILAEKLNLAIEIPERPPLLGLGGFDPKYPELKGLFEERYPIHIYMYSKGGGKSKQTYTAFSLKCENPRKQEFSMAREDLFSKLGKAIAGGRDIEVRDQEFDSRYILKSPEPLFVKELFADPDFREFFIKYDYAFTMGKLQLTYDSLEFEAVTTLSSEHIRKRFVVAIRLAVKLAERLEEMGEK